jgi:hypothetical protein
VSGSTLVEEPVAAGVAWLTHRYLITGDRPAGTLLVVDMGGGTLDVAVLQVRGGPRPDVSVLACLGTVSAGDALDAALARDLAVLAGPAQIDPGLAPELAWALLERAARETKVALSTAAEHVVVLPAQVGHAEPVRYPRPRLESAFSSSVDGAEGLVLSALRLARLAAWPPPSLTPAQLRALPREELTGAVDAVLVVGGMSRIPYLRARLADLLPKALVVDDLGVEPEEAVAIGLADPVGFDGVRLSRPPFDLVLDTPAGRVVAYEAYTPLVEPWQIYSGASDLGYDRWLRPPELPSHGSAMLRAIDPDGMPLWLTVDGVRVDGLPVPLGPSGVGLGLSCDGGLAIVDGAGATVVLATDGWPVPGPDHAGPTLRSLTP